MQLKTICKENTACWETKKQNLLKKKRRRRRKRRKMIKDFLGPSPTLNPLGGDLWRIPGPWEQNGNRSPIDIRLLTSAWASYSTQSSPEPGSKPFIFKQILGKEARNCTWDIHERPDCHLAVTLQGTARKKKAETLYCGHWAIHKSTSHPFRPRQPAQSQLPFWGGFKQRFKVGN